MAGAEPDLGGPIEYVIELNDLGPQVVSLRCVGTVLRSERASEASQPQFRIAATLERYEFIRDR
jgi:hypothetical protein